MYTNNCQILRVIHIPVINLTSRFYAGQGPRAGGALARHFIQAKKRTPQSGLGNPPMPAAVGSKHGFRGVFRVAFGERLAQFFHGPALDLTDSFL